MKTLVAVILIMTGYLGQAAAAPASPIWPVSVGVEGANSFFFNYFGNNLHSASSFFQTGEMKYLKVSTTAGNGMRFSLGYGLGRRDETGDGYKAILAGIDKQVNDNWWVTLGYERDRSLFGVINVGAAYSISPNVALSIGYSFHNNYESKNTVRTQLYINF